jgi:hypothetical protein
MSQVALATCKCGEVQFELIGPPIFSVYCCCNDCIVSEHYVDKKAKEAGVENISCLEKGNPQSIAGMM